MSSARLKRLLLPLLRGYIAGKPRTYRTLDAARQAIFLLGKPAAKKTSGRLRREQKRATHKEETAKIREAVMDRADFHCESCGLVWAVPPLQLDHFLGGSGRRRQKQSVETCWALCPPCHHNRTYSLPTAEHWNERFRLHCEKHRYPVIEHIIHAEPAKAGGAP